MLINKELEIILLFFFLVTRSFCRSWRRYHLLNKNVSLYITKRVEPPEILTCSDFLFWRYDLDKATQSVFTCSKLTIETLDPGVKYVQS